MKGKCFFFSTGHLDNIKKDHLSGQHKFDFRENTFFTKALKSVSSSSSLYPTFLKKPSLKLLQQLSHHEYSTT